METQTPTQDVDAAAYAALAKEVSDDNVQAVTEQPEPQKEPEAPEPEKVEAQEQKDDPKPDTDYKRQYEELRGALGEERHQRKSLREQNEKLASQVSNMQHLLEGLTKQQQEARRAEEEQFLTPEEIQSRRLAEELGQVKTQNQELAEWRQQQERQAQEASQHDALVQSIVSAERAFAQTTPDYHDAAQALAQSRLQELAVFYPDESPQVHEIARQWGFAGPQQLREAMLHQDTMKIAVQASQLGTDPAAYIYQLAKQRGYTGKAQPAPQQPNPNTMQMVKDGQKAAGSLSTGTSTPTDASGFPSQAELADMYVSDPDKADDVWKQMKSAGLL